MSAASYLLYGGLVSLSNLLQPFASGRTDPLLPSTRCTENRIRTAQPLFSPTFRLGQPGQDYRKAC